MGAALGYSSSMAGLEGLTHFDLSHNNLSGVVPSQVRTSHPLRAGRCMRP